MLFLTYQILYDAEKRTKTKMHVLLMFNTNVVEGLKTILLKFSFREKGLYKKLSICGQDGSDSWSSKKLIKRVRQGQILDFGESSPAHTWVFCLRLQFPTPSSTFSHFQRQELPLIQSSMQPGF